MKKQNVFTKIAFGIDIAAFLALLIYFAAVAPNAPITNLGGLLILSPPLFGIFGIIFSTIGYVKDRTKLGIILIIINIVFLCWWPIVWYGGTLLLGP